MSSVYRKVIAIGLSVTAIVPTYTNLIAVIENETLVRMFGSACLHAKTASTRAGLMGVILMPGGEHLKGLATIGSYEGNDASQFLWLRHVILPPQPYVLNFEIDVKVKRKLKTSDIIAFVTIADVAAVMSMYFAIGFFLKKS